MAESNRTMWSLPLPVPERELKFAEAISERYCGRAHEAVVRSRVPWGSTAAAGVERIGEWVSADRSARGDAHAVTDADADDAWLAVHVVGALLLRLEKRLKA